MSELGDDFRALRQFRKEQHAQWKIDNTRIIAESGLPYKSLNDGECLVLRVPGKPKCDFYPSTGRWSIAGGQHVRRGGAKAFLGWFKKQTG
jgi:hypothetical protein